MIREYVWFDGAAVAVIEGGVVYYIRSDHIGRPVFATNGAGVQVWTASYLPFGGDRTATGTANNLRFLGQWFQSESGLHQNWMRDYDPTTGRCIQADPLGLIDGASVYGYARQSPGRYTDARGEDTLIVPSYPSGLPSDWAADASHLDPSGMVFKNLCCEARLFFHYGSLGVSGHGGKDHWHFNPSGNMSTRARYRHNVTEGKRGRDYLLPGDEIEYSGCEQKQLEAVAALVFL